LTQPEPSQTPQPHLARSLVAVIVGSLVLRMAASAMGENIQFYFNAIHQAALDPTHPLRQIFGAGSVYQISYTLGGIIIGTFFAAELVGALFFGAWSDRYGRKLFIIFGPLFGAIAVQITALTTVIWLLVVTRLLEGLSTASNAPATLGYIAEASSHSPKLRTRIVGFFEIATIGGMAGGFTLGGWLWRHFGSPAIVAGIRLTSPAFAINAAVYLASLAILWLGLHEMRENRQTAAQTVSAGETLKRYWRIVSHPRVASFAPAWIAVNAVLGIWVNLTARILTDKGKFPGQVLVGGFDSLQAGYVLSAYAVFFVVGILIWTTVFPGIKKTSAMMIGVVGLFVSCLLLYAINHEPSIQAPLVLPLGVLLVISIMVQSGFTPSALGHLADITESFSNDRGIIMGLYSVFLGIGQFFGTSLGGPFVDWLGADGMILAVGLLGVIAGFLVLRLQSVERQHARLLTSQVPEAAGTDPS
jgi:MFS family permease